MDNIRTDYSVLMAVYRKDNPEYLKISIESMLSQTVPPEQFVIVIDGAVSSEIESIIRQYSHKKELFTVVRLKENAGLGNALNTGLNYCRNNLVARMDADDISKPDRCEKELALFTKYPHLAVCGCNMGEFYDSTYSIKTSRNVPAKYRDIINFSRCRQPFNHPTVIYKKDVIMKCGGYSRLRRKEDFDLFSRIISNGYYVRNINKSLYLYRADEENFRRRKSKENLLCAFYVYSMHWRRKGCNFFDFLLMCCGEIILFALPGRLMKWLSDKLLRD